MWAARPEGRMRILETALYAENLDETADFYQHVLGLERFAEARIWGL